MPSKRGRPKGSGLTRGNALLLYAVWRTVREEQEFRGVVGVVKACEAIASRHRIRVVVKEGGGAVLLDAVKMRQWFYSALRRREVDPVFNSRCFSWEAELPNAKRRLAEAEDLRARWLELERSGLQRVDPMAALRRTTMRKR